MTAAPLIRDLAAILGVAGVVTLVMRRIRQPVVLGYVVAGFLTRSFVVDLPGVRVWAELGVIFLMFSLGLEFSFRKLAKVGISAALTACLEVSLMMGLGVSTGRFLLGWSLWDSVFLGAMIAISSTTIIIKALDELKLKSRRFAEMIFAVLIVEDLIAILMLVGLSSAVGGVAASKQFSGLDLLSSAARLFITIGGWFLAGYFVVPRFIRYVGRLGNDEMLTVLAMALCLSLAVAASALDYSVALGAFIMGSILSESSESYRIEELISPLRDVFAAVFFVSVGMLIDLHSVYQHWGSILVVAIVLIFGKIINITLGSLVTGQTLRTSIQVGFGMAQVGEFSFIIAGLGQAMHVTSDFLYPVAVAVSVISAFTTPYLIRYSHKFAVNLERWLPLRVKTALSRYAAWTQAQKADSAQQANFYRLVFKWVLNGNLVTVVFILVGELTKGHWSPWLAWLLAFVISAPFLWAMFFSFAGFRVGKGNQIIGGGELFLSRLLSLVWIGALGLEFFTGDRAALITAGLAIALFVAFHRQLGESYQWFEGHFLSTFKTTTKTKRPVDMRHLAPWDAHLVRFKVHPNSEIAGKRLSEIDLRARFGLNVVVIQRGLQSIVAPSPDTPVFPKDELLVLGTDEQVDAARTKIEKPPGLAERFRHLSGYELRQILITGESELLGRTVRDSGIRETCGGMVVGLERGEERLINPSSNLKIQEGDVLWIVGETEKLAELSI